MIFVDDRQGSGDFTPQLIERGFEAETLRMEFGDLAFYGRGEKGTEVSIGIELKKLPDLLDSLRSGRLADHQVPGMLNRETGLYDRGWLVVEGQFRKDAKTGALLVPSSRRHGREWEAARGQWTHSEMKKRLLTLTMMWGIHVEFCDDRAATLDFIADLYHWWTDQAEDEHKSHLAEHRVHNWLRLSDFRELVCKFPHIGLAASKAIEGRFGGNLLDACKASVDDWAGIQVADKSGKTKRLGIKVAEDVWKFIRGLS